VSAGRANIPEKKEQARKSRHRRLAGATLGANAACPLPARAAVGGACGQSPRPQIVGRDVDQRRRFMSTRPVV
jgi:hypothetical protein